MTEILAGTELAPVDIPTGQTGFGLAETAYLLGLMDGAASARSRDVLMVPEDLMSGNARDLGASSLVARGLVAVVEGRTESRSAAALLEYTAGRAERWVLIAVVGGGDDDRALVLHAPGAVGYLQPRAYGTWFATFSGDSAATADGVLQLVGAFIAERPDAAVVVNVLDASDTVSRIAVRRDHDSQTWDTVLDPGHPDVRVPLTDDALRQRLADALPPLTVTGR